MLHVVIHLVHVGIRHFLDLMTGVCRHCTSVQGMIHCYCLLCHFKTLARGHCVSQNIYDPHRVVVEERNEKIW